MKLSCIPDLELTISKPEAGSDIKLTNNKTQVGDFFVVDMKNNMRCLSFGYETDIM